MTNQTRDFDADDGRVLAEFCGYERRHCDNWNSETYVADYWYDEENEEWVVPCEKWQPWSPEAPMWQRKAILDAVREKGLRVEFIEELENEIYGLDELKMWHRDYGFVSAPPEAICQSILELEGD